jgi:hypothetical protein
MMSIVDTSPVFICGHPKSGTSLLRNLLDSHPQLIVFPEETTFFRHLYPHIKDEKPAEALELAVAHLTRFFEWNRESPPEHQAGFYDRDYSHVDDQQVKARMRAYLEAEGVRHPGDYLTAAARSLAATFGLEAMEEKKWVEKTPYNERFAELIFSWWPDAHCLHIVRDPRDNYASYRRKQRHWQAGFFANSWVRSIDSGFNNQLKFGKDHYLILRYEDLVDDLDAVLTNVCAFLSIEFVESLRNPSHMGAAWRGNSMFGTVFDTVSPAPVGRWKTELTQSDTAQMEWIGRKYIRRLRYTQGVPKRLKDVVRAVIWQAREALYRLRHPGSEGRG